MPKPSEEDGLPFPESLCHLCAAPPRLIQTAKATYIFCPLFRKYPPQPVLACVRFVRRAEADNPPGGRTP